MKSHVALLTPLMLSCSFSIFFFCHSVTLKKFNVSHSIHQHEEIDSMENHRALHSEHCIMPFTVSTVFKEKDPARSEIPCSICLLIFSVGENKVQCAYIVPCSYLHGIWLCPWEFTAIQFHSVTLLQTINTFPFSFFDIVGPPSPWVA